MSKRQVLIRIDEDLNNRWNKVAKKLNMTKSGMVEDFLNEVIPILEQEQPKDIMKMALKKTGEQINLTASLFE